MNGKQLKNMSDITFFTTSLNTKWINLQKSLIQKQVPGSKHVIISGKKDWPAVWFDWIKELDKIDTEWFCHIDEDCFLWKGEEEFEKLKKYCLNNHLDIVGPKDHGYTMRNFNSLALNSFFMFGRTKSIKPSMFVRLVKNPTQDMHQYFQGQDLSNWKRNYEPYYPFFWTLAYNKKRIGYIEAANDPRFACKTGKYQPTKIRVPGSKDWLATHMWYLRQWNIEPHNYRYNKIEKALKF